MKNIAKVALRSTLAVAMGFTLTNVFAQDEREHTSGHSVKKDAVSVDTVPDKVRAGRTAYIDPDTGELKSTPTGQDKAVSTPESLSTERVDVNEPDLVAPQEIKHPDGTVEILLNGQVDSALRVTVDCAGSTQTKHSNEEKSVTETDACQ